MINNQQTTWDDLTPLEQAQSTYSDFYKDVYGIRPRWMDTSTWTMAEFDVEFMALAEQAKINDAEEKVREAEAIRNFEATVQLGIDAGANDRETALRWIMDTSEANGDWEYFCYLNGLPYHYFKEIK